MALLEFISSLNKNELAELMALMWFGRGDFSNDPAEFPRALEKAQFDVNLDESPGYIAEKIPLEKYLRNGLRYLNK